MKNLRMPVLLLTAMAALNASARAAWTWERLEYPGAAYTYANEIWENQIVGNWGVEGGGGGFVYDGTEWSPLDFPGAAWTQPEGIWRNQIVGYYQMQEWGFYEAGFYYDGQTWTTLAYPGASSTRPMGVYDGRVVGSYTDRDYENHGFIYEDGQWTTLDFGGRATWPQDIWGDTIVGFTWSPNQGFVYEGGTWQTVHPAMAGTSGIQGVWEDRFVGVCQIPDEPLSQGFLITRDSFTWLGPEYAGVNVSGIYGDRIVGRYTPEPDGPAYSFLLTIPEPASLALLALGGLALLRRRR